MGRPKKTAEKLFDSSPALDLEPETPVAQQRHRIVTEFVKTVPVDEIEPETVDDDIDDDERSDSAAAAIEDPIEALLREIGASQSNWLLVVDRLPNFSKDGNWSPRAKWVRCGTIPLTPELLIGEAYVEEIQNRWARPGKANDFRLCVRRDNKIFAYLPVLTIEPPEPEVLAKVMANEQPHQFNFQLPQQDNSLDSFLKQAEKFAKLRAVFGWEAPAQQAQQNPSPQPLTTEAALLHIVSADESLLDKAVGGLSKLFRRGSEEVREIGLLDIAFEAIKNNTLPQLVREFRAMMEQTNGQTPMGAPQVPLAPVERRQQPDFQNTSQETRLPVKEDQSHLSSKHPPQVELLNYAITACAQQAPISGAVAWINGFEDRNPDVGPFIESFLAMTPDEALHWLVMAIPQAQPIAHAPHAKQWIADLQNGLKGDDAGESNNTA